MRHGISFLFPFVAAGLLTIASTAFAQEADPDLPGRDDVEAGEVFVAQVERDWQIRCIRSEDDAIPDRCEMFQTLEEDNGNAVAEMRLSASVSAPETADDILATITILTPLETLLSPGLQLAIDGGDAATIPYGFCREAGCVVQIGLSDADLNVFRNGADANITLFALIQDQEGQIGGAPVEVVASLRGFTAAYNALEERMVEIRAFIAEQVAAAQAAAEADGAESESAEGEASE